jgi:hypothetical protein
MDPDFTLQNSLSTSCRSPPLASPVDGVISEITRTPPSTNQISLAASVKLHNNNVTLYTCEDTFLDCTLDC